MEYTTDLDLGEQQGKSYYLTFQHTLFIIPVNKHLYKLEENTASSFAPIYIRWGCFFINLCQQILTSQALSEWCNCAPSL